MRGQRQGRQKESWELHLRLSPFDAPGVLGAILRTGKFSASIRYDQVRLAWIYSDCFSCLPSERPCRACKEDAGRSGAGERCFFAITWDFSLSPVAPLCPLFPLGVLGVLSATLMLEVFRFDQTRSGTIRHDQARLAWIYSEQGLIGTPLGSRMMNNMGDVFSTYATRLLCLPPFPATSVPQLGPILENTP